MSDVEAVRKLAERTIAEGSKSFALASRILPTDKRLDVWLLYAWCRYADDQIDQSPIQERPQALLKLRRDIDALYGDAPITDPLWEALREVLSRSEMPREYLSTLVDGMQMDVDGIIYRSFDELLLYCHRVAGVVGFMMAQLLGVSRLAALRSAAHLGLAMQLTNICRDVLEDWNGRRLYLPDAMLSHYGVANLYERLGQPLRYGDAIAMSRVVEALLKRADEFYASADVGARHLDARSAFAVRTARLVYCEIGQVVRARKCDVLMGRAVVTTKRKLLLVGQAALTCAREVPLRLLEPHVAVRVATAARFPEDVLP